MTKLPEKIALTILLIAFCDASALGQEMTIPEKCKSASSNMAASKDQATNMPGMATTDFQKDFMAGMQKMDPAMMQGMMQDDADTAFVCGMIAHHWGAIAMSETELKYGDDKAAKRMARKIIDAQAKEIKKMEKWLDANGK